MTQDRRRTCERQLCSLLRLVSAVTAVVGSILVLSLTGFPHLSQNSVAEAPGGGEVSFAALNELVIRYSRLTDEEPVGIGVTEEHRSIAALAFEGLQIPGDQYSLQPLFGEVVDEMRSQNLSENLALLSLINKYGTTSARFLASTFFEHLQERNSKYGFARAFVVRFQSQQNIQTLLKHIAQRRSFFKTNNLIVQAFQVTLSPAVGLKVDSPSGVLPPAIPVCNKTIATVAVIGDQFITRTDLPQFSSTSMMSGVGSGCDSVAYKNSSESLGTNLASVVSQMCSTCKVLGFDAGCGYKGSSFIRSTEGARSVLQAVLKGAQVLLFSTADIRKDGVYDDALYAATNAGVVVVAPAGDESQKEMRYPSAIKGVIGVGSKTSSNARSDFSNYGSWVVAAAKGEGVAVAHNQSGVISASSTLLAAARVAGLISRYLTRVPLETLPNLAVLAATGRLSDPDPAECPGQSTGGSGGTGSTGSNGGSAGSSSGGSGNGSGGSGSNSNGSNNGAPGSGGSSGGSSATSTPTATPTATPTGGSTGGNNSSNRSLATLDIPSNMKVAQLGRSPFEIAKFQSTLNTQGVKVGTVVQTGENKEAFVASAPGVVADVVYQKNTPIENLLKSYTALRNPASIDTSLNEFVVTLSAPLGHDFKTALAGQTGLVGVFLHEQDSHRAGATSERVSSPHISVSAAADDNKAALSEMGWNDGVQEFTGRFTEKVKVAIISTGIELSNQKFRSALSNNLLVTASYRDAQGRLIQGDFPADTDGFGTQVASLLGHDRFGIAKNYIELIPIQVATTPAQLEMNDLVRGVALAVNKGAEVVVLPHSFNGNGCDPVLGHAMYRAREKGVTFVVAAGDGLANASNESVGFPVVAARDDGPLSYEPTSSPSCWSRYFLGAISFAASDGFQKPLPQFSNYGDDIELSAMGIALGTKGLQNRSIDTKGTAFSAAWGAAAAAMAIAHHKSLGLRYGPWYIENLLVASARRDPNALNTGRRNRFGSLLNFTGLMNLLIRTETMTDTQRRNDIETINPRQGDGWKPGEDKANLKYVALSLGKGVARPGEEVPFRVVAYFRSGEERDVTSDATNTVITIEAKSGKRYLEVVRPGVLKISDLASFALFKGNATFSVTANFNHEQAQGFDSAVIKIDLKAKPREVTDVTVVSPKTPVRVGQELNLFQALAKYSDNSSEEITGGATWTTSDPSELRAALIPGVVDARNAIAGKSYTVTATFGGKSGQITVPVVGEELKSFYIHNYLGQSGTIERGQKVTLEARMILTSSDVEREQVVNAAWFNGATPVNGGARSRSLTIDTSNLAVGTYTYRAVAAFRSQSGNRELSTNIQIVVADEISRIEIHLKTPIVQIGQPFFIDLRAYRHNNSYSVVTEQATWTSDAPQFVSINRSGVGFISDDFNGGTVTVFAEYKGQRAQIKIAAIRGSVVTGSNSLIDYLTLKVDVRDNWYTYCSFPLATVEAKYKDGQTRNLSVASVSYAELGSDAQWKNATLPLYGGRTYRVSATYNDGTTASGGGGNAIASTTFIMPKKRADSIDFGYPTQTSPETVFRNSLNFTSIGSINWEGSLSLCSTNTCSFTDATTDPRGLSIGYYGTGNCISLSLNNLGVHTLTAKGYYTGMGVRELKEGAFRMNVKDAVPVEAILREDIPNYLRDATAHSAFGTHDFEFSLRDSEGRQVYFSPDDLEISLMRMGQPVDLKNDVRIRMDRDRRGAGMSPYAHFTIHAYPQTLNQTYQLSVRHKPSNFVSSRSFTDIGSWESSDSTPWNLPSEELPVKNEMIHPVCERYLKAPTGLEFAGGTGRDDDPLIICDPRQLKGFKEPFRSKYCQQAGVVCRGSAKPEDQGKFKVVLGANIDFRGEKILPIEEGGYLWTTIFDGVMHSISNYVIIDSEKPNQGLFKSGVNARNLIIENPTVRGALRTAALSVGDYSTLDNVTLIGGTVWGDYYVGGLVTSGSSLSNVRVFGTEVRSDRGSVGGVACQLFVGDKILFTGRVAPSGVPGSGSHVGGIASSIERLAPLFNGRVSNVLMTGTVIGDGEYTGGIVATNRGILINSVMKGHVVSTGASVGGAAGISHPWSGWGIFGPFGVDSAQGDNPNRFVRNQGIIRARVEGDIWGGMSRKQLECIDKVASILGVGGGTNCVGDVFKQTGGISAVGGIVGTNMGLIQESEFRGTVRGIAGVGGIAGISAWEAYRGSVLRGVGNYVRNTSAGTISASEGATENGALIGSAEFLAGVIRPRLDSNIVTPKDGNPAWAVGKWGNTTRSMKTSNVPDYYDR